MAKGMEARSRRPGRPRRQRALRPLATKSGPSFGNRLRPPKWAERLCYVWLRAGAFRVAAWLPRARGRSAFQAVVGWRRRGGSGVHRRRTKGPQRAASRYKAIGLSPATRRVASDRLWPSELVGEARGGQESGCLSACQGRVALVGSSDPHGAFCLAALPVLRGVSRFVK